MYSRPPGSLSHGNEDARASLLYPLADIDRTRASSKRYAFVAKLVAQSCGVAFCDIFETFDALPDGGAAYLSDGMHLSPKGQARVFDELLGCIADHCPSLVSASLAGREREGAGPPPPQAITPCPATTSPANLGSQSLIPHHLPWHSNVDDECYGLQLKGPGDRAAEETSAPRVSDGSTASALPPSSRGSRGSKGDLRRSSSLPDIKGINTPDRA